MDKKMDSKTIELRKELLQNLTYMNDDQLEIINRLINMISNEGITKRSILNFIHDGSYTGIDTALPVDYIRKVKELLPSFSYAFNVMDYNDNTFGEVVNIAEKLVLKLNYEFNK